MKSLFIILLFLVCFLPGYAQLNIKEDVAVVTALQQSVLKAGTAGQLTISLKPKKGIHVTADPPFTFSLDTLTQFFSVGKPNFTKDGKGYVDTRHQIRHELSVAKTTPPGSYRVKGVFTYFYCSDAEGWCSRFRHPVELTVNVAR